MFLPGTSVSYVINPVEGCHPMNKYLEDPTLLDRDPETAVLPFYVQYLFFTRQSKVLVEAVDSGYEELVRLCLEHGADVHTDCGEEASLRQPLPPPHFSSFKSPDRPLYFTRRYTDTILMKK
jgi:hypothetical protein